MHGHRLRSLYREADLRPPSLCWNYRGVAALAAEGQSPYCTLAVRVSGAHSGEVVNALGCLRGVRACDFVNEDEVLNLSLLRSDFERAGDQLAVS